MPTQGKKQKTSEAKKTSVGDNISAENANWSFGGDVSKSFDSHVSKSVPLYHQGHELISMISDFFLHDNSICYDLGCSTGQLTQLLAKRTEPRNVHFIGIDCEHGMIQVAREKCSELKTVTFEQSDLMDLDFEKADLIVCYYTIQFVSPKNRQLLFDRIYNALNWGAGFLMFEKVRAPDARFQDMMNTIYSIDYKLNQGYDPEEIISKTRSLKGVLEPFSTNGNIDFLKRAGFVDIMSIMKYVCFEGFLAIK